MLQYLKARLRERSSWVAIGQALSLLGLSINPEIFAGIIATLAAVGFILPDTQQ